MAPAIAHFLVGASLVLLVAAPLAARYDLDGRWPLWLVVVGGIWGLGPDIYHVTPVYQAPLETFHYTSWADLFAFHHTLDRPFVRARYDASVFGAIALFLGAVSVYTVADVLELRRKGTEEPARPTLSSPSLLFLSAAILGGLVSLLVYATIA
ncbi:hypothetical protein [Natronosalvus rutilus]|uniref:Uncharacterized protein n=1 Tax=Natronosalvus rutilus TaxID=2953753 RepID=A0A9E7SX70_9EURY|nr:hypothetical protein [Natronosalvus rutilus]UTF54731.1 hypothetical protein NGM29_05525 [Natronosalvus rutilus]